MLSLPLEGTVSESIDRKCREQEPQWEEAGGKKEKAVILVML
jgi:hypothetical protein